MRKILLRFKTAFLFLITSLVLGPFPALAQKIDLGVDLVAGVPQNEWRENLSEEGYGCLLHIGSFIGDTPLMIGTDIGYMNYGTDKRREIFSYSIPDVIVDVRNTNNILMLHGFARIQRRKGLVRPYFEGLLGFRYFFTRTTIKEHWYTEPIVSYTNFDDFSRSWGIGMGVDIEIWQAQRAVRSHGIVDVSVNIGLQQLWGSEAEYLKKGSIEQDPYGGITYNVLQSRTDMIVPKIGIRVRF
jgi:hypothetical protein